MLFAKPFKAFKSEHNCLGPKKIMSYTIDVISTCDKECPLDAQVLEGRIKLRRGTYASWVKLKASLKLKGDDTLACYLLASSGTMSSSWEDSQFEESPAT